MGNDQAAINRRQYLTFYLGQDEYAVAVLSVKEIIEYGVVTRVPTTPSYIRGVINLRGSVVPVIDLAVRFGLPESAVSRRTCIVIVETMLLGERVVMGVVADSVSQVIEFSPDDIEAPPVFGTQVRLEYLTGMAKVGAKFVLILNMDAVLSQHELGMTMATRAPLQASPPVEGAPAS
jgi:purine-binding chemotaxis protein CheW